MIAIHKYPRSFDFHKQPGKKPAVKLHTSQHRRNSNSSSSTKYDMSSSSDSHHREGKRAAGTVQCKFQTSAGGCRRGKDCPFKHTAAKPRGRIMQELELDDHDDNTIDAVTAAADNGTTTALQLDVTCDASVMISDTDADCGGSRSMEQSLSPCKQSTTAAIVVDSIEQHRSNSNSNSSNRDTGMEVEAIDDDLNTAMRRLYIPREISFGRGRGRHRLSGF
jgi:hypothetical protein